MVRTLWRRCMAPIRRHPWREGPGPCWGCLPVRLILAMAAMPAGPAAATGPSDAADAYEIVAGAAMPVLPPPVRSLLEAHDDAFRRGYSAGATAAIEADTCRDQGHFIMLDAAARGVGGRHEAALRFPREQANAERLFRDLGVHDGGSLPWLLSEQYHVLVRSLAAGASESAAQQAGLLVHLATDASLPLNTTACAEADACSGHDARTTVAPMDAGRLADRPLIARSLRDRVHAGLIAHLGARLRYEVHVWPGRFEPSTDPESAVFDALLDAHASVEALVRIDERATMAGSSQARASAKQMRTAYHQAAADSAGPLLEQRLEAGALLAANLIGRAWVDAGRPTHDSAREPAQPRAGAGMPYMGSSGSMIYHLATCSHARRIKTANCVRFRTVEAARAAGRVPCKTCCSGGG